MSLADVAGLHVGTVETCSPTEIKVLLDGDAPQDMAFNTGRPQGFPRLNGYVLIPNEGGAVVAVISRMSMEPAPAGGGEREPSAVRLPASRRRLFVTPLGTLEATVLGSNRAFKLHRGVSSYPAVGDAVTLATADQLRAIVEASGDDRRVRIGSAKLALDAPVTIDPDKLFGRHVGVFGNTGSGKSCTVAGLIRWSIEEAASAGQAHPRFIILDPNGEYRTCFGDLSPKVDVKVFSVEPGENEEELTVPGWMWNGQEWAGALNASPGTQRPILMQAIRRLRAATLGEPDREGEAIVDADAERILAATQVRSYLEWIQGCRAEGVAAMSFYPKMKACHENLAGLEDLLGALAGRTSGDLQDAVLRAAEISERVRERRTDHARDGNDYPRQLQDADFVEVANALDAVRALLPEVTMVGGPSEDTPSRFDPAGLPGMIELIASLMPGNLHQHVAGLTLRVQTLLSDSRISPIIAPEGGGSDLSDWLHAVLGHPSGVRGQVTVIDLSLVPSDVLTTIVAVLGRIVFEAAQRFRRSCGATMPTVLVLEEAHNFVERQSFDGDDGGPSARCRQVFEKIAKEGRKFGVGLMVSSQRPAELSPTIVAQCNSFVLHRIVNDRDQELVTRLSPDSSGSLLKELPSLPTQKAILMGIASEIPLVFDVRALDKPHRPTSENPDFWGVWTGARVLEHDLADIALGWSTG